jgi:hypothetical protein
LTEAIFRKNYETRTKKWKFERKRQTEEVELNIRVKIKSKIDTKRHEEPVKKYVFAYRRRGRKASFLGGGGVGNMVYCQQTSSFSWPLGI